MRNRFQALAALLLVSLGLTFSATRAHAAADETPLAVLRTGNGAALTTFAQEFSLSLVPSVEFAFGFATDESLTPSLFLDSVTVTVRDVLTAESIILATIDGSGTVWAPLSPGTVFLSEGDIVRRSTVPPDFSSNPSNRTAWSVQANLPTGWAGRDVSLLVDLFDNQNAAPSLGWISPVSPIPEPSTWQLTLLTLLFFLGFKSHRP